MARTVARLTDGVRITDHISLGVVSRAVPLCRVKAVLKEMGRSSQRHRELPAHVMVYYVIALALFMDVSYREVLRCLLEGIQWLLGTGQQVKVTGKSGISQARTRLGWEVLKRLYDELVTPIASRATRGAWYRDWRLVSLDGSTLDIADTQANAAAFGRYRGQRGPAGYPQLRFVSLVENGTHVLFGAAAAPYSTGEGTLAREVIGALKEGMLCLADRLYYGFELWQQAQATGADLLWRMRLNVKLPVHRRLPDGSYLSRVYRVNANRRDHRNWLLVRVIDYTLDGNPEAEPLYRLVTTILDPARAPAEELAALYHERWEIETAFDEFKTHLRGPRIVLRSKTPELVRQEFYGLLLAHFAIRGLMHEAALKADVDPDKLSYIHAVRVLRRKLPQSIALPPSAESSLP